MKIVILGATGKTGTHVLRQALDAGHRVVAYVRRPEALPRRPGLDAVKGELDDVPAMTSAFAGADAVICCIGPKLGLGALLHTDLMQRCLGPITAAARQAGVPRFVLMSAFGVGDTAARASLPTRLGYRTAMASIFGDKARAEAILPASGLDWTAVYPVILYEGPARPRVTVLPLEQVERVPGLPRVPFANVAAVLLELAARPGAGQRLLITA
jgi:uncharacterized protein YbjT (DUF2867 family)